MRERTVSVFADTPIYYMVDEGHPTDGKPVLLLAVNERLGFEIAEALQKHWGDIDEGPRQLFHKMIEVTKREPE